MIIVCSPDQNGEKYSIFDVGLVQGPIFLISYIKFGNKTETCNLTCKLLARALWLGLVLFVMKFLEFVKSLVAFKLRSVWWWVLDLSKALGRLFRSIWNVFFFCNYYRVLFYLAILYIRTCLLEIAVNKSFRFVFVDYAQFFY